MNWNGKIDADSIVGRTIQLWTSWRIYAGIVVLMAAMVVPPELGYPENYFVGFMAGVIGYIAATHIMGTATDSGET